MQTFRDVIEAFGVASFAKLIGVEQSHARAMKTRNSIPPEYWATVVENAPAEHKSEITFDALRAMRAQRFAGVAA
jgi:hypothetical protein